MTGAVQNDRAAGAVPGPTRRDFIQTLAAVAGYSAATAALGALGVTVSTPASAAEPLALPAELGRGQRVAVVGAGISGLVTAYELRRAGFEVQVFEARERVGGRNWTVRNGTRIDLEADDGQALRQTVAWDRDSYFNAGPARLPTHHRTILGYAREFGVALETEVNSSRSAYVRGAAPGSQPLPLRRFAHDTRGYLSELLSKSTQQGALDQTLGAEDRARLLDLLKVYGDLDTEGRYRGSLRAGFKQHPGAGAVPPIKQEPLPLATLLDPDLWIAHAYDESIDQQPTMLQPVGGMDRIPYAFLAQLGKAVHLGTELRGLRQDANGVRLQLRSKGRDETRQFDYAVLAVPAPVLAKVDGGFAPDVQQALEAVHFDAANKIAWQSRRFWETEDGIYGGLSFVKAEASLVWYPSGGFHKPRGILIGNYNTGDGARKLAAKSLEAQYAASRATIELLHPGRSAELQAPVAVSWHQVPYSRGPWVHWDRPDAPPFVLLNEPDGRVHFAGDWLAQVGAWQEGAALSAHKTVRAIAARVRPA